MKIPKTFRLLGRTYTVVIVPKSQWTIDDAVAYFEAQADRIVIKKDKREAMEHAFFHELLHAVFNAMGRDKLFNDEALIDNAAGLLHQALTSAT